MADTPNIASAVGAIACTAVDQLRLLAMGQIDRWSVRLQQRFHGEQSAPDGTGPVAPNSARPLIIGALAGVAIVFLIREAQQRHD